MPNYSIPNNSTKVKYGRVNLTHFIPLVDAIEMFSDSSINSVEPLSFEKLGQVVLFFIN